MLKTRQKNNFFIVGAQRCGTTYLYNLLDEHPQIEMAKPIKPEPKFFITKRVYERDYKIYISNHFKNINFNNSLLGEKSTSYLESISYARNINDFFPESKILILLRNPIYRAISHYKFSKANKLEKLSFQEAYKRDILGIKSRPFNSSVDPFDYFGRGKFINYIENYLKIIDKSRIKIIILENLTGNLNEIQMIYEWLGVEKKYFPNCLNQIANEGFGEVICSSEFLDELLSYYTKSIESLEKLLGYNLSVWKR